LQAEPRSSPRKKQAALHSTPPSKKKIPQASSKATAPAKKVAPQEKSQSTPKKSARKAVPQSAAGHHDRSKMKKVSMAKQIQLLDEALSSP
jgi:hypothetical protein